MLNTLASTPIAAKKRPMLIELMSYNCIMVVCGPNDDDDVGGSALPAYRGVGVVSRKVTWWDC